MRWCWRIIETVVVVGILVFLMWRFSEDVVEMILLVFGTVLLAISIWAWIGFVIVMKMRQPFNVAALSEFLSMSLIGSGLVIIRWSPLLGFLLVITGLISGFVLLRILRSITKKRYLDIPDEEMERYIKGRYGTHGEEERKQERGGGPMSQSEVSINQGGRNSQDIFSIIGDPLYGMVQVMCVSYFSYMARWKDTYGDGSFKPIYAARYAVYTRNSSWSVSFLNSFLAGVSSFKELLLAVCAEQDEMPDRVEELRNWLEHQTEFNIPLGVWSKEEALESSIGYKRNLGF